MVQLSVRYEDTPFLETSETHAQPNRLNWRCKMLLTQNIKAIRGKRIKVYVGRDKYVIKDPRMCITFPVWQKMLGENVRIINIIRDPNAVAASLTKRDGFTLQKGIELWHIFTERASKYSKNYPAYFLKYEDLFSDRRREILKGLSDFFGINTGLEKIAEQVINPDLNHSASSITRLPPDLREYAIYIQRNRKKFEKAIKLVHKYEKYKTILDEATKNNITVALSPFDRVNYYFTRYVVKNITKPFRRLWRRFNSKKTKNR